MRAGQKQSSSGKMPASETEKRTKDAPVVGRINRKPELDQEMDDADDPTEDVTEDAADGAEGDDDPMLVQPDGNEKRKNKKSPAK